jgi:type I restriction enzyme S subunit
VSEDEELPEGWAWSKLGGLVREPPRNGHSAKASPNGKGVRTLTLSAVTYGDFSEKNTKVTVADPAKVGDLWLEPDDLLVERSNTPELVGTTRLYRGPRHFAIFPDLVIRVRLRREVLPRFAELTLQSEELRRYFTEKAQGTAGSMPKIDQGAVLDALVRLAPLPEQHRIVEQVEALLAQVTKAKDRLDRVKFILKRFRQAVLAAACSGKLTEEWREARAPKDAGTRLSELEQGRLRLWTARQDGVSRSRKYTPPFSVKAPDDVDLPETWVWTNVSHLALLDVGAAFKSAEFRDRGIRLLRGENVEPGALRWSETKFWPKDALKEYEHLLVKPGEIILAMDRPLISKGLKIARVRQSDVPALLVQRVMRFSMVDPADADFLYLILQQQRFIEFLRHDGMTGTDLPHITGTGVAEFAVPHPPREEQTEIVRIVNRMFTLADAIEARLTTATARAEKLPQSILSKAFKGELVPTEAELARAEGRSFESAEEMLARVKATTAASRERATARPTSTRGSRESRTPRSTRS